MTRVVPVGYHGRLRSRPSFVLVAGLISAVLAARAAAQPTPAPGSGSGSGSVSGITADAIAAMHPLEPHARSAMRAICEAGDAGCDRMALLGRLERATLIRALRDRNLIVDPAPTGKRIGRILVVTLPPFGKEVGLLQWANRLHVDSKASIIAREVIARPGDPWSQDAIDETQRKLRDPLFASVALIVPVRSADETSDPATVDLLVVNRDIFSLRMNSNYELQDRQIIFLALSLSENNFLGRRKLAAFTFTMDQGSIALGPLYIDKNLLGRRLDLRLRGGPIFSRATGALEGSDGAITLSRPLWSLKSKWSWNLAVSGGNTVERRFTGASLDTYDADGDRTTTDDQVPLRYRLRRWSAGGGLVRAWGDRFEQRVTVGYALSSQRPSIQDDVVATTAPAVLDQFRADVLPRSERAGQASVSYEIFTAHYRDYIDIDLYDLAEDVRLGPRLEVGLGAAPRLLGSDRPFGRASLDAAWTVPWGGDGLASLSASLSTRIEDGAAVDRSAQTTLRVVSPATPAGRLVGEVRLAGLFRERGNGYFTLGGDSGLRGFNVGAFKGERRAVAQLEARTRSARFLFGIRWGLLAFYDVGHAADTVRELALQHDVGIGLRSLTPQLSRQVFRFDLAWPLTGDPVTRFHPRFIAGYSQAF